MADGHALNRETMSSICMQDIDCAIVPISRPINHVSKRISEALCRNELKKYMSTPYSFYMDSDVVLTSERDISDCIEFLENNTAVDAVALDTKHINVEKQAKKWVVIAAMCIRSEVLENITFRPTYTDGRELCCCIAINNDINIEYLDNRKLSEIERK